MSGGWKNKRFWTQVLRESVPGGYTVQLDSRPLRTPAKAALIVPTAAMADAIADEWQAQTGEIDPARMPVTRAANAAIDKVTPQRGEVAARLADYGATDLLCYRAETPYELRARQDAAWDPLLDWAAQTLGSRLAVTTGITPVPQPEKARARLKQRVLALDPFTLAGFHDLVGISGSLVIGLAALHGAFKPEDLWKRSRIDEDWQVEQWGEDTIATHEAETKHRDFLRAQHFLRLCKEEG